MIDDIAIGAPLSRNLGSPTVPGEAVEAYRTAPQIGSASGAAERVEVERLNSLEVGGL